MDRIMRAVIFLIASAGILIASADSLIVSQDWSDESEVLLGLSWVSDWSDWSEVLLRNFLITN